LIQGSGVVEGGLICLPEPGTLTLLGVGVVGLCRRPQFKA
jgi:hypothetical protein